MPLPVSPAPRSTDVAIQGWPAITVRVAWTLLGLGIEPRRDLLNDVRTHVLYHLDPHTPLTHAEDLATRLTTTFIARTRGRTPSDPWPADWDVPIAQRWRRSLDSQLDEPGRLVLRKHYGDRRSLEWLARHASAEGRTVDVAAIAQIRDSLRALARRSGGPDGIARWPDARVDRFLERLAAFAPPPCPRVLDVSEGCYPEHVLTCPRCDRMLRLLQHEEIGVEDLQPPSIGARPLEQAKVLALHLHPDARRARRRLREALGEGAFAYGDDLILVDGEEPLRHAETLRIAAEIGEPAREHLRGVLLEGPGRWTARGLCGPLADQAASEVVFRPWGHLDAIGELPLPMPVPPSAARIWALVSLLGVVALLLTPAALRWYPWQHAGPTTTVSFEPDVRAGTWVHFDVSDVSTVTLVAEQGRSLVTLVPGRSALDKVPLAVGDGTYRAWIEGEGALLTVSAGPIPELNELIRLAQREPKPLEALAASLDDRAEVYWRRR